MTPLDHAIASLDSSLRRTLAILWGYQDVRDGRPRSAREPMIHHVEYLDLYRQARQDAELLAGEREEAMNPTLTAKAQREIEDLLKARTKALDIFKLVVAEWSSDPMSVQCFDLRIVNEAKRLDALMRKLDCLY